MKEIRKKIKKKLILMLLLAGLTGCKSREAQILIDGFQEAQTQADAEEAGKETSESDSNKANMDSDTGQKDGELEADEKKQERSEEVSTSSGEDVEAEEGTVTENQTQPEMIFVDVCGAVANPGVFELEAGSRVFQAIEAAGGYLPEAAQTCINRAGVLVDGQQLYILTQEEMEQQGIKPAEMANASGNTGNLPDTQAEGSAGTVQGSIDATQADASSGAPGQQDNRVNINTADETQLTTLTGIGVTRAQAIIAYRKENGPFAAIEEIMNVQGIKEGTFAKIKDEIVVE